MDRLQLERLKRRDEAAFERLILDHQDAIVRYLYGILGNREDALELAQEVFLAAFRFIDNFRGDCSLRSWLFKIALNLSKNHFRYRDRRHIRQTSSFDDAFERADMRPVGSISTNPEQLAEGKEMEFLLNQGLQELSLEFREALILRDVELLSYEEIAELTGLPDGTVKSRIHRARMQLTQYMRKMTREDP